MQPTMGDRPIKTGSRRHQLNSAVRRGQPLSPLVLDLEDAFHFDGGIERQAGHADSGAGTARQGGIGTAPAESVSADQVIDTAA